MQIDSHGSIELPNVCSISESTLRSLVNVVFVFRYV